MPLPPIPVIETESRLAVSRFGFKYFKGATKLAQEFVRMGKENKI
jgi:hypothetical protein